MKEFTYKNINSCCDKMLLIFIRDLRMDKLKKIKLNHNETKIIKSKCKRKELFFIILVPAFGYSPF